MAHLTLRVPELIEDATNELPGAFRHLMQRLLDHLKELDRQVGEIEGQIAAWHRNNALSRKLAAVPGIGAVTASALVAAVGDAKNFSNGRQFAAWLGLVPRQNSSGGKNVLLGISKAWRRVPAHATDPRCARHSLCLLTQKGAGGELAHQIACAAPRQRRGRCAGQQECTCSVGAIGSRPRIPTRLLSRLPNCIVQLDRRRLKPHNQIRRSRPPIAQAIQQVMA